MALLWIAAAPVAASAEEAESLAAEAAEAAEAVDAQAPEADSLAPVVETEWGAFRAITVDEMRARNAVYSSDPCVTISYGDIDSTQVSVETRSDGVTVYYDTGVARDGITLLMVNGSLVGSQETFIQNGRTMVPLRVVSERLGFDVSWDEAAQRATVRREGAVVELAIGSKEAFANGATVALDAPPMIVNDKTCVPLRFIAESLSAWVGYLPYDSEENPYGEALVWVDTASGGARLQGMVGVNPETARAQIQSHFIEAYDTNTAAASGATQGALAAMRADVVATANALQYTTAFSRYYYYQSSGMRYLVNMFTDERFQVVPDGNTIRWAPFHDASDIHWSVLTP